MTKEEIQIKIKEAMAYHTYICLTRPPTAIEWKEVVSKSLTQIAEAKTINVHCNPMAKLWLVEKFWLDDFNYLGTRIRIIAEENLITGLFNIMDMNEKYNYLVIVDNVAICYVETIC